MSDELPVEFNEGQATSVPVQLDEKAQKKKERLELLAMYPELGSKVLKVKAKDLAAIGKQVELVGVKKVGLGSLAVSNEMVLANFLKCDAHAQKIEASGTACCDETIIAIRQLQKQFGDQLIEIAKTYLDVDKHAGNGKADKPLSMVFPSGQPMVVAINSSPKEKVDQVEKQLPE